MSARSAPGLLKTSPSREREREIGWRRSWSSCFWKKSLDNLKQPESLRCKALFRRDLVAHTAAPKICNGPTKPQLQKSLEMQQEDNTVKHIRISVSVTATRVSL